MTEFSEKLLSSFTHEGAIWLFQEYPIDNFKLKFTYQDEGEKDYNLEIQLILRDEKYKNNVLTRDLTIGVRRMLDDFMNLLIQSFSNMVLSNDEERRFYLNDSSFVEEVSKIFTETCKQFLLRQPYRVEVIYLLIYLIGTGDIDLIKEKIGIINDLLTRCGIDIKNLINEMEGE